MARGEGGWGPSTSSVVDRVCVWPGRLRGRTPGFGLLLYLWRRPFTSSRLTGQTKLKLCRPPARRGVSKHGVPTVPLPSPSERGSLTSPAWGRGQERAGAARGPAGLGVVWRLRNQLSKAPHGSGARGRSLGDGGRGGACLRFRPILLAPPLSALRLRLGRALQRPGSGGGGGWSWAWRREGRGGASGTAGPRLGRLRLGLALHSVAAGALGSVSPPGSAR